MQTLSPQSTHDLAPGALPAHRALVTGALQSAARRRRVLVVDDNLDAAETLHLLLQIAGHVSALAHDGLGALALARELQPQVAILDLGLPGLDGFQLGQALRQEPWGKELLLIALSGWAAPAHRARTQAAGFDHHLAKAVDPKVLLDLLR
jgi:CheY-like chemotaxis protein